MKSISISNELALMGHFMSQVQAVMTFDLGCAAGDAAWAPYSATVFAAAGEDGRVQVLFPS